MKKGGGELKAIADVVFSGCRPEFGKCGREYVALFVDMIPGEERSFAQRFGGSVEVRRIASRGPDGERAGTFWLVWREGTIPHVQHPDEAAARCEAERLAAMNPGQMFHVLQATSASQSSGVVTTELA